jgi:hypothetical protein
LRKISQLYSVATDSHVFLLAFLSFSHFSFRAFVCEKKAFDLFSLSVLSQYFFYCAEWNTKENENNQYLWMVSTVFEGFV